jgi:hypothetical protein
VRVLTEQEIGFGAEMAERSTTKGNRFARYPAVRGVVGPFVGQFTCQPSAPKLAGVKGDLPRRASLVLCPYQANADARLSGRLRDTGKLVVVISPARHQR